ncbi:MAG: C26 family cysteine hydrolase domain-containing family [Candidatus Latescibacteria bacterium]|jgi:hypothetical protein|nr:C26 family cysteine hydrolase domain-containing family [Candidatus Latescibacterota bacterium]
MIVWVRVETPEKYELKQGDFHLKRRFEELSGDLCLVIHLSQMDPGVLQALKPRALLLSGCGTFFRHFKPESLYPFEDTLHAMPDVPTIGFCGSHQFLGIMFKDGFRNLTELDDEMMRPLKPGEPDPQSDPNPDAAGFYSEEGFHSVQALSTDPLFDGLPERFVVRESHYAEVKRLPPDFNLIASNENCRIQAMKHRTRPLYGTQFHPEAWVETYPHGREILQNFFRIAGILP